MRIFFYTIFLVLVSCKSKMENKSTQFVDSASGNLKSYEGQISLLKPDLTVYEFMQIIKADDSSDFQSIRLERAFPKDWIRQVDLDSMMTLITSKEKCKCILNPISSHLPFADSADLGGYAIEIIKAYREQRPFQYKLWACPKSNEKEANELTRWYDTLNVSRLR